MQFVASAGPSQKACNRRNSGAEQQDWPHPYQLSFISRTAMELVRFPLEEDIYRYIAARLREIVGESVIVVNAYDPAPDTMTCRAVEGVGGHASAVLRLLGQHPVGSVFQINERARESLLTGALHKVDGGFYDIAFGRIPRIAARGIERLLNIREFYAMGIAEDGALRGSTVIGLASGRLLYNSDVIETFLNQAAVALQHWKARHALNQKEASYQSLMEQVSDIILVTDGDGTILSANPAAVNEFSDGADLAGRNWRDLGWLSPATLSSLAVEHDSAACSDTLATCIVERELGNGLIKAFELRRSKLSDGHILISGYDVTERDRLDRKIIELNSRERHRVGRELQDSLAQELVGGVFLAASLEKQLAVANQPSASEAKRLSSIMRHSVTELRRLAKQLSPLDLDTYALASKLRELTEDICENYNVRCRCTIPSTALVEDRGIATHLFLFAQETLNYALRRGAKRIDLSFTTHNGEGQLAVWFDGQLPAVESLFMRDDALGTAACRARLIRGSLATHAESGGIRITCTFRNRELAGDVYKAPPVQRGADPPST
ncbi:MAG: PAS domain-containing protein [Candidatus Pacebacteria bacterium]|nr:PAS domain-containing protein [Candidatus Paceibacterota bacterium]